MNILFLDIDGVLVTPHELRFGEVPFVFANHVRHYHQFNPACVIRLNKIIEENKCSLVISSAWRIGSDEDFSILTKYIASQGIAGTILGRTPSNIGTYKSVIFARARGEEIQKWLDEHNNIGKFIIVDDSNDMEHLTPWLIKTEFEGGLQDKHVELARRLFNKTDEIR